MIKIQDLSFAYSQKSPVFLNFNWDIDLGERWSIIGPSGCGKTTLLYLLAGLRAPTSGKIDVDSGYPDNHKSITGLILQDFGLLPWATAHENVALGLKIHGCEKKTANQTARKWLAKLNIEAVANHYPAELSGGQRQRVAIARTLALEPSLLMMDEPFASLDTLTREALLDLILEAWRARPATMLLVTHNIEEAVFWGQKVMLLSQSPNTHPIIVENPASGSSHYRNSPQYAAGCQHLRGLLETTNCGSLR